MSHQNTNKSAEPTREKQRSTNGYCQKRHPVHLPTICAAALPCLGNKSKNENTTRLSKMDSVLLFDPWCAYLPKTPAPFMLPNVLYMPSLRVLSPELLTYVANALRVVRVHGIRALRATHVLILVVQVLRILNVLLSVGIRVRVVGLLGSTNRLVSRRLPARTAHVGAATDAAILARRVRGGWFQS